MSECDLISRKIRRKGMRDAEGKFQHMLIQFTGPLLNQLNYLYRKFLENVWTQTLMHWNKTLTGF